jgi:hypothetical protein
LRKEVLAMKQSTVQLLLCLTCLALVGCSSTRETVRLEGGIPVEKTISSRDTGQPLKISKRVTGNVDVLVVYRRPEQSLRLFRASDAETHVDAWFGYDLTTGATVPPCFCGDLVQGGNHIRRGGKDIAWFIGATNDQAGNARIIILLNESISLVELEPQAVTGLPAETPTPYTIVGMGKVPLVQSGRQLVLEVPTGEAIGIEFLVQEGRLLAFATSLEQR